MVKQSKMFSPFPHLPVMSNVSCNGFASNEVECGCDELRLILSIWSAFFSRDSRFIPHSFWFDNFRLEIARRVCIAHVQVPNDAGDPAKD